MKDAFLNDIPLSFLRKLHEERDGARARARYTSRDEERIIQNRRSGFPSIELSTR